MGIQAEDNTVPASISKAAYRPRRNSDNPDGTPIQAVGAGFFSREFRSEGSVTGGNRTLTPLGTGF